MIKLPNLFSNIKKANKNNLDKISIKAPISKEIHQLLIILYKEGYISKFCYKVDKNNKYRVVIFFNRGLNSTNKILNIKNISKQSNRVYCSTKLL